MNDPKPIDVTKIKKAKTKAESKEVIRPVKEPEKKDRAPKGSWYWGWWVDLKNAAFDYLTNEDNRREIIENIIKLLKKLFKKK